MSDNNGRVETAMDFSHVLRNEFEWSRDWHAIGKLIAERDAAIRAAQRKETAGEVLDRVGRWFLDRESGEDANVATLAFLVNKLRREYDQETKMENVGIRSFNGDELAAHDAAVARAAKVEVLRDAMKFWEEHPNIAGNHLTTPEWIQKQKDIFWIPIAVRHGIQPHELEPEKKYAVGDIQLKSFDFAAEGIMWRIVCGEWSWFSKDGWNKVDAGSFFPELTAKLIADKLRADGNVPGGGK